MRHLLLRIRQWPLHLVGCLFLSGESSRKSTPLQVGTNLGFLLPLHLCLHSEKIAMIFFKEGSMGLQTYGMEDLPFLLKTSFLFPRI